MALPKDNRMTKTDFSKRFRSGKRVRGRTLFLQYGPEQIPKIAIVVQARAVPGAATRNQIRRQLGGFMETLLQQFSKPVWVAVIVHTKPHNIAATKDELQELLKKSGIIEA